MTIPWLLLVLMGAGLGAVVYAGLGLILVAIWVREKAGWRCPRCHKRTLELIWWLESYPTPSRGYFECTSCGARLSHVRLSRIRPGPWNDASDSSFDKYYDGTTPGSINKRRAAALRESVEATVPAPSPESYQGHVRGFAAAAPAGGREGSTSEH